MSKVDSKEVGLVAGLHVFHFFLGAKDLHFGLWHDDMEVCIQNLPVAQKNYTDFLTSHIPDGVNRILDVGCGAGGVATELLARGYHVEGVSPSPLLSEAAQKRAGEGFKIYPGRFEDLKFTDGDKFDLVLFSESFQYIPLDSAFVKAKQFLKPGGYVLICDFFKIDNPGRTVIGGGHRFNKFTRALEASGLEVIEDKDITRETAPNLDIVQQMESDLFLPTFNLIGYTMSHNYPILSKLLRWRYRKKIRKLYRKYTAGDRSGANFKKFKAYRLYLLRLQDH